MPWTEAAAEALIIAYGTAREEDETADAGLDGFSIAYRARSIVFEMSAAAGPKRAMEHLAAHLGLTDEQGIVFPTDTPAEIFLLFEVVANWMAEDMDSTSAISAAARIINGSDLAEEARDPRP